MIKTLLGIVLLCAGIAVGVLDLDLFGLPSVAVAVVLVVLGIALIVSARRDARRRRNEAGDVFDAVADLAGEIADGVDL